MPQKPLPLRPNRFRRHWGLAPHTVFLNHGSFGACPKPVLALQAKLRREMEAEPVQFLWRRYEERLEPARRALAKFVGADARDMVFTTNATSGVNAVVRSVVRTPVLLSGGERGGDEEVLDKARMAMEAGALGLIFGRNTWQREHDESLRFIARLRELLEKYPS